MFTASHIAIEDGTPVLTYSDAVAQYRHAVGYGLEHWPSRETLEQALEANGWTYVRHFNGWAYQGRPEIEGSR